VDDVVENIDVGGDGLIGSMLGDIVLEDKSDGVECLENVEGHMDDEGIVVSFDFRNFSVVI
jgi:hypothetical protein